ncbi:MAG: tRNA uridine-5-carboxymethylaminomethyl(34) synthesis GTPase MnmE [Bacilli bacterium]|jgi:tRNA modification GTPase|nr:tRNA uridine-5-carboxymethylaminomethyl(34) synthesis GTPase MnmE [Bacilli bacterium]MCH4210395.1 tRNA uridine-5-carboxymethylaminomethyl(34) synthesis GTPase MnmE [Bacilli bacterium]MCH4228929.1 tRNA uridine-5-carboxymethylaminomethyl(34) synthesis GTPase MnmE [Bacilli bacterium]MCI2055057.1 tRNA uridine-5-carboxymethylaminomethyl(34) synthesis GTPase MnmE [Bacilli bacterium]
MNNVIIALATPPLKSALALIRISGEGCFAMTDKLFSKKVSGIKDKTIFVGHIKDGGEDIDLVEVLAYPGPKTMTGEDVVEISCHGSMLIANEIIGAYLKQGARYATRGEFSSRAFYNGKMDLVEAEAVNDLINATSSESKKLSLMSLNGATSKLVAPLKKEIADLLSLIEVNIDYPEYTDIEEANESKISSSIDSIRDTLASLIKGGKEGKIIKEGLKVAIVGEPNVGKSSLLNALMNEEKAIVSDIPGTTRDIVEGDINLKGITLHLLDTAGIRSGADKLEEMGIERSEKSILSADVVILVLDARVGLKEEDKRIEQLAKDKILITVYNKDDLVKKKEDGRLYISALNKDISPLLNKIYEDLGISDEAFDNPSLNNARQLGLLSKIDSCLAEARQDCLNQMPIDLVSVNLYSAYNAARELLGEETTTDLTDEIFSRFCVGK